MTAGTGARSIRMLILALAAAPPLAAQEAPTLQHRVEATLAAAGPGTRFGFVVAAEDGRELVSIAPESRFIPASVAKLFTTAAAFATLEGLDRPDTARGAAVRLEANGRGAPDVVLEGNGDTRLSSAPDCAADCLAALADAVAAKARIVGNVIGDDSLYPDQRWSPGMSWNNIPTPSGTATSALSLDNNELAMRVSPASRGRAPTVDLAPYYTVDNRAVTVEAGATNLRFDRLPGGFLVRLTGTIAVRAEPFILGLGIDDPAHYAAWRFKALIEARGVRVTGAINVRHRVLLPAVDPQVRNRAPPARARRPDALARLAAPPLAEDLRLINKDSQNLYSELLLRRVGLRNGTGSLEDGLAAVRAMLERAGVPRAYYQLSDGSGMSSYNRLAPRGTVMFLRWSAAQPWASAWRATLPIGGVDGTLDDRFKGTALEGRIFAKTGTLNATSALSGYMTARSGRTLIFSIYANDIPEGAGAVEAMDSALLLVAGES